MSLTMRLYFPSTNKHYIGIEFWIDSEVQSYDRVLGEQVLPFFFTFPSWSQDGYHSSKHHVLTQQYLQLERRSGFSPHMFLSCQGTNLSPKCLCPALLLRYQWTGFNHLHTLYAREVGAGGFMMVLVSKGSKFD